MPHRRSQDITMENGKTPPLFAEKADGSVVEIGEEDLYRYNRHRWIFNESRELTTRYLKFDLHNLLKIAIHAVGNGATSCTRVLKCSEGLHNKAFLLTMDSGDEVFAKLPNPNAGPAHYTTASEVATRKFLLEGLKISTPRIYAWSSDPVNPVGAEYILEERAPGRPLGDVWHRWPRKWRLDMIAQVTEMETTLASTTFSQHGCIYFRNDLPGGPSANGALVTDPCLPRSVTDQLTLGPLTTAELWKGERSRMALGRGPWYSPLEFVRAMGKSEMQWVKTHAAPRRNYHRSMEQPEMPHDVLVLLEQYMDMSPYLVPESNDGLLHSNTLWHPDLHLDNIFVDPESRKITRIVDWQSAAVAPIFLQCRVPGLFRHHKPISDDWAVPVQPENYVALGEAEQRKVDRDMESEVYHKYYKYQTYKGNPRHWTALSRNDIPIRTSPVALVSGVWQNRDTFFLRQSQLTLIERWAQLEPNSGPCPISFTKRELELHASEDENVSGVGNLLKTLRDEGMLPADGMVDPADYDRARGACAKLRDVFLRSAESEAQRELFARIWPYQDTEE